MDNSPTSQWPENLLRAEVFPHPVTELNLIQTHISWVIKTGTQVYKIKKPVNFGFLNFSTLELRKQYCEIEFKLNQRFAPHLYQQVCRILGPVHHPRISTSPHETGEVLEYAIQMQQFDERGLFSHLQSAGELKEEHLKALALEVAHFHNKIDREIPDPHLGTAESINQPVLQNFEQIRPFLKEGSDLSKIDEIEAWAKAFYAQHMAYFNTRRQMGFVRACHGDLYLDNIVLFEGKPTLFDCIEFNEEFRWIDVFNDIAFLMMDLEFRGRSDLAYVFLNEYLTQTGDYEGLILLRYFQCYRAVVRAKIALFSLEPSQSEEVTDALWDRYRRYVDLALSYLHVEGKQMILLQGLSGTGKSTLAKQWAPRIKGIHIRADIERKRMNQVDFLEHGQTKMLYTPEQHEKTYERLRELSGIILDAGFPVLIDAAFLKKDSRQIALEWGLKKQAACVMVSCQAPHELIRERIEQRGLHGQDPSDATWEVVKQQIQEQEPFTDEEQAFSVSVDLSQPLNWSELEEQIRALKIINLASS